MKLDIAATLLFDANQIEPGLFLSVFQQGFIAQALVGVTIKELLTEEFGLNQIYVEERIKTVFLDGKPVDDFNKTIVKNGSTLALSAAMPGLVGATFRKGGNLAVFRSTITHNCVGSRAEKETGYVKLKLFNLLVKELGIYFLKRGIFLDAKTANEALYHRTEHFWKSCKKARIENLKLTSEKLIDVNWSELAGLVYIRFE